MDIFCDKSGCYKFNRVSHLVIIWGIGFRVRQRIEKFGSCLFYVYSFRKGRVASANMSFFLYRGRLIIGHLIYCQFTFNVTKMSTPNKSICIQNVNRINGDIIPINTWFCFDFVSSVYRGPFNNVQLPVYIIKIKHVLYTQLSQLSHISQELLKHNSIAMCCHTIYTEKKCLFHIIASKKCALGKIPFLLLRHAQNHSFLSMILT